MIRRRDLGFAFGYLTYYLAFGVFLPYWSVHLIGLGFAATAVGGVLAVFNTVRIVSPLVGGWWLDRAVERKHVLVTGAALATVAAAWVGVARAPAPVVLSMAIYSLVFTATLPALDAVVLERLGADRALYGRLRLWGSAGFVVMVLAVGGLVQRFGDAVIPVALVIGHVAALVSFLGLPRVGGHDGPRAGEVGAFGRLLGDGPTRLLLVIAFLQIGSFGAFNGFYTLFLRHYGYGARTIGVLWALGVLAEIVLFWVSPRLLRHGSLRHLLLASVGVTVVRWVAVALAPTSPWINAVAQVTHAAGFGLFQACSVLLAARFAPPGGAGRSQALLAAAGAGAGGIVGSLVAGALYDRVSPAAAFLGGAGFAVGALVLCASPAFVRRCDAGRDAQRPNRLPSPP